MIIHIRYRTCIIAAAAALFLACPFAFHVFAQNGFPINDTASCISSSCHANFNAKKKYRHEPAEDKSGCALICHQPAAPNRHEFTPLPAAIAERCLQCHDAPDLKAANSAEPGAMKLHQPVAEGRCTACHVPHSADAYRLLKRNHPGELYETYSEKAYDLCLSCHAGMRKALAEPRTLSATNFRNGNLNLHHRHVNRTKGRTCRTCHRHHGAQNPKLIANAFVLGAKTLRMKYEKTDTGGSCATACHIPVKYDRCSPEDNMILTTPREGADAAADALARACGNK